MSTIPPMPAWSNTCMVYAPGARLVSMAESALTAERANIANCATEAERAPAPPQPLFGAIIAPEDEWSCSSGVSMSPETLKAASPGPTALRTTFSWPDPAMTNPAIRIWVPFSSSREDRLRSRLLGEALVVRPPDEAIEIVRFDVDEPPEPVAVTATVYVPLPAGIPEIMPVPLLMLSPGGRPEAE